MIDETIEHSIADDLAIERFEFWASKRTGCAASATNNDFFPDADGGLKEEAPAEWDSNGKSWCSTSDTLHMFYKNITF